MTYCRNSRGFPFASFFNHFLIITCTKSWMEHSACLCLCYHSQTNTISLFLKKKNLQGFNYSQAGREPSWEAAPLPSTASARPVPAKPVVPPGRTAEAPGLRRAPRTPGERVLTGQGDDAAEVLVAAHTTSSSWGQRK